jgi:hypothetical protein
MPTVLNLAIQHNDAEAIAELTFSSAEIEAVLKLLFADTIVTNGFQDLHILAAVCD